MIERIAATFGPAATLPTCSQFFDDAGTAPQLFVQSTDGSNPRLLGNQPEGFTAATLSGNGKVIYAATPLGRLLRIDVVTGETRQLTGPIPLITDVQPCPGFSCDLGVGSLAPGSVAWVLGSAFEGDGDEKPSLMVNGIAAPTFIRADGYLRFQVPWETPVNQRISIVVESPSRQPMLTRGMKVSSRLACS